jgi:hypothetical protein
MQSLLIAITIHIQVISNFKSGVGAFQCFNDVNHGYGQGKEGEGDRHEKLLQFKFTGSSNKFSQGSGKFAGRSGKLSEGSRKCSPGLFVFYCFRFGELRVKYFDTVRTKTVTKIRCRMLPDIYFHLLPVPFVIADFFTFTAYGQQAF